MNSENEGTQTHRERERELTAMLFGCADGCTVTAAAVIVGAYYKSHKNLAAFHTIHLRWEIKFGHTTQTTKKLTVDGERCALHVPLFCFLGRFSERYFRRRQAKTASWCGYTAYTHKLAHRHWHHTNELKLKDLLWYTCILIHFQYISMYYGGACARIVIIRNEVVCVCVCINCMSTYTLC